MHAFVRNVNMRLLRLIRPSSEVMGRVVWEELAPLRGGYCLRRQGDELRAAVSTSLTSVGVYQAAAPDQTAIFVWATVTI